MSETPSDIKLEKDPPISVNGQENDNSDQEEPNQDAADAEQSSKKSPQQANESEPNPADVEQNSKQKPVSESEHQEKRSQEADLEPVDIKALLVLLGNLLADMNQKQQQKFLEFIAKPENGSSQALAKWLVDNNLVKSNFDLKTELEKNGVDSEQIAAMLEAGRDKN